MCPDIGMGSCINRLRRVPSSRVSLGLNECTWVARQSRVRRPSKAVASRSGTRHLHDCPWGFCRWHRIAFIDATSRCQNAWTSPTSAGLGDDENGICARHFTCCGTGGATATRSDPTLSTVDLRQPKLLCRGPRRGATSRTASRPRIHLIMQRQKSGKRRPGACPS